MQLFFFSVSSEKKNLDDENLSLRDRVCVCVCERERERERDQNACETEPVKEKSDLLTNFLSLRRYFDE